MRTYTSIEGHLNMAINDIKGELPRIRQLEQVEQAAKSILQMWDGGCSFDDLAKPMSALAIVLAGTKK